MQLFNVLALLLLPLYKQTAHHIRGAFKQEDNHMKNMDKIDAREIRRKLGLNQQQFWSKLGVTQSGGSRYESGRNMPRPVQHLLRLVHVEQIDIQKIKKEDYEVVEFLKSKKSDLFKELKKEAKAQKKG
jgi:DNA-binding transcriptional regulator YiaG